MKAQFRKIIKSILARYNIAIVRANKLQQLEDYELDVEAFLALPTKEKVQFFSLLPHSKSQMQQDLFVLSQLNYKKGGFFVEFGATNGVALSNTHILETQLNWKGILAEPAKCWHENLYKNRSCHIETKCVWTDTGDTLKFNEVSDPELSTINSFTKADFLADFRKNEQHYDVQTISLLDLLSKYNAPKVIDYLSIDTEGSEYEILNSFDFNAYQFRVITCEHNYTKDRNKIFDLLSQYGYTRRYTGFSRCDDWYVNESLVSSKKPQTSVQDETLIT